MKNISAELLQSLKPFRDLPFRECEALLAHIEIREMLSGERMFSGDGQDHWVYLIDGRVEYCEQLQSALFIKHDEKRALSPLFEADAFEVHIESQSLCRILFIDRSVVDDVIKHEVFASYESNIELNHVELNIYNEIIQATEKGTLDLPSLPEVALRVKAAIGQENVNANDVERIIEADPVMAVRLIQVANSALVRGIEPVESVRDAIVRLGLAMTQNLVLSLSVKQLFKSDVPILRKYMSILYQHSIEISAFSFSLAEQVKGLNADQLLLAGLVHDIGVIPVLAYIEKTGFEIDEKNEKEVGRIISKLRAAIGVLIVQHWGFPESIVSVVQNAEVWTYNSGEKIDMSDIVNLAHVLSLLKNKQAHLMPDINQITAFKKMFPDQQDSTFTDDILLQAKEKVAEVKCLLRF